MIFYRPSLHLNQKKSIIGKWKEILDENSIMIFEELNYWTLYNKDTIFTGTYSRSSNTCDSIYFSKANSNNNILDFIRLSDGTCYEITGINDTILAYRYTSSGRIHVFKKAK